MSRLCWGVALPLRRSFVSTGTRGLVTATSPKQIKRFYDSTSAEQHGDLWRVFLDKRPVKTPRGTFLELPSQPLALAVAQEWGAQGETLKPKEMPLTTVACTAVDLIRPDKEGCVSRLLPYLTMDTLCFEDDNEFLAELQAKEWGPLRNWFEGRFNVTLGVARGLGAPSHPDGTELAVEADLKLRDEWELSAIEIATQTAKSLVAATVLVERADIEAKDAFRWANLEEHFQIERWGLVEGEHDVSHSDALMWMEACRRFGQHGRNLHPE